MQFLNLFQKEMKKIWLFQENNLPLQRQSMWLTIQVSFLRGQAVYVTTHFSYSRTAMCGFLLSETIHHHLKESLTQSKICCKDTSFLGNSKTNRKE